MKEGIGGDQKGGRRLEVRSIGLPAESIIALQSDGPRRVV